jgi:hypothetical protein
MAGIKVKFLWRRTDIHETAFQWSRNAVSRTTKRRFEESPFVNQPNSLFVCVL